MPNAKKFQIPAELKRQSMSAAISLINWGTTRLADGRASTDDWKALITEHIGPQVRAVVVARAERLRIKREKEGYTGRDVAWVDAINSGADAIRFRDWATSAFADGRIDAEEIVDLLLNHIAPGVLEAVAEKASAAKAEKAAKAAAKKAAAKKAAANAGAE